MYKIYLITVRKPQQSVSSLNRQVVTYSNRIFSYQISI